MSSFISFASVEWHIEGEGGDLREHDVQFRVPPHLVLGVLLVLIQQLLLGKIDALRHLQFVLQVLLEEERLSGLLVLLVLVRVDGVLVEIVLGVEVGPHRKGKHDCLLDPVEEAVPDVSILYVAVQSEETAQRDAPFDRGYGVRVAEHILALQVVHLLYLQAVALLRTHWLL